MKTRGVSKIVRMDGAEARKERIAEIARLTHAALFEAKDVGWISLSRWVTKLMIKMGLTRKKIMEILRLLADDEQFVVDEKDAKIRYAEQDKPRV